MSEVKVTYGSRSPGQSTVAGVKRCIYEDCQDLVEGTFYLAPGCEQTHPWPLSVPYLNEPLPLCSWHGRLVGDERATEPH